MNWLQIDHKARIPKYQQIVDSLIAGLESGTVQSGERLPSINETSERLYLSRNTVERAYAELHRQGLVMSVLRKGYFVADARRQTRTRVCVLTGDLTGSSVTFVRSFMQQIGLGVMADVFPFHYRADRFNELVDKHLGDYHYFVVLPQFREVDSQILKRLNNIPRERLILVNNQFDELRAYGQHIGHSLETEFCRLLQANRSIWQRYEQINLVLPTDSYFHIDLLNGFMKAAQSLQVEYEILDGLVDEFITADQCYFIVDEGDMAEALRQINEQRLRIGKDIGLVALNDNPFNEWLAGGIASIMEQTQSVAAEVAGVVSWSRKIDDAVVSLRFEKRNSI